MLNKVKKIFFVSNPLFYLHILKIVPNQNLLRNEKKILF